MYGAWRCVEAGCIRKQHQEAMIDEQPLNMNSSFVNALSYSFRKYIARSVITFFLRTNGKILIGGFSLSRH